MVGKYIIHVYQQNNIILKYVCVCVTVYVYTEGKSSVNKFEKNCIMEVHTHMHTDNRI
jgi:hypothetical protein